jgi:hypothetical protein
VPLLRTQLGGCASALCVLILGPLMLRGSDLVAGHNRCDFVGAPSCASASCHGAPHGRSPNSLVGREYLSWLRSDPHAMAAQRMLESRFLDVLRRASQRADGTADPTMTRRCAACHDPLHDSSHTPREDGRAPSLGDGGRSVMPIVSGIECETCHGGARKWLPQHFERDVSRQQLVDAGMIDTKNLLVRAQLCSKCHVGAADHDMNHDMIAAGHPPLRFELASYEALIPQKHWDDRPRRRIEQDYEVQLWAAGQFAAAEAALTLLEGRAKRAAESAQSQSPNSWPEFAETSCFACHQPLRANVTPRIIPGPRFGVPPWQTWNTALLEPINVLAPLRSSMEASLTPDPAEVSRLAREARQRLAASWHLSQVTSFAVLEEFGTARETATWEELCQRLAALVAVERSLRDRGAIDLRLSQAWHARADRVAARLRFSSSDGQWPRIFTEKDVSLSDLSRKLEALSQELRRAAGAIGPEAGP